MSDKGHNSDLSYNSLLLCSSCKVCNATLSLFTLFRQQMFYFSSWKIANKVSTLLHNIFLNLFLSHFLMNTWSSTCSTADMCNRKIPVEWQTSRPACSHALSLSNSAGLNRIVTFEMVHKRNVFAAAENTILIKHPNAVNLFYKAGNREHVKGQWVFILCAT